MEEGDTGSPHKASDGFLLPIEAIFHFLSILEKITKRPTRNLQQLGDVTHLRSLLIGLGFDLSSDELSHRSSFARQDIVGLLSGIKSLLRHKYDGTLAQIQSDFGPRSTATERQYRRLAEVMVVCAIESPKLNEVVDRIMTDLPAPTQLLIQQTIENFSRETPDWTSETLSSLSGGYSFEASAPDSHLESTQPAEGLTVYHGGAGAGAASDESLLSTEHAATDSGPGRGKPVLPRLSLDLLPRKATVEQVPFTANVSEGRVPRVVSEETTLTSTEQQRQRTRGSVETSNDAALWREKYELLRQTYHASEVAREELQTQLDMQKKDFEKMKVQVSSVSTAQKAHTTASQVNYSQTVDLLEREITSLRNERDELIRSHKQEQRRYESEIESLRDENRLLRNEAAQADKAELLASRWKSKAQDAIHLEEKVAELEASLEDYIKRLVDAEAQIAAQPDFLRTIETYKTKVADLETAQVELRARIEDEKSRAQQKANALEVVEREKLALEYRLNATIQDYEHRLDEVRTTVSAKPSGVDLDIASRERMARLEKELELLKKDQPSPTRLRERINQLEAQVDDANRVKERMEREYKTLLSKLTLLESEKVAMATSSVSTLGVGMEELGRKERELSICHSKIDALTTHNKSLEAQLEQEKSRLALQEDLLRTRVEGQFEVVTTTLKTQLRIRDKELAFAHAMREEQTLAHRREEHLMSLAFHELGLRYLQTSTDNERMREELNAIHAKVHGSSRTKVSEASGGGSRPSFLTRPTASESAAAPASMSSHLPLPK